MELPGYRREGFEIILSIDWHPWEPVAAMDMTGRASAQRAAAVIQGNLRDRPKDVLTNRLERDDLREQHWRDARTKYIGDPALGSGETEHAIGGRDQPPGKADPFRLVAVEQLVGRARPVRAAASFPPRLIASPTPAFIPCPPAGLWM